MLLFQQIFFPGPSFPKVGGHDLLSLQCGHGQCLGQMLVSAALLPAGWKSHWHVNALGFAPNWPGLNCTLRFSWDRYSDQQACLCVSFLVEVKYSRFL